MLIKKPAILIADANPHSRALLRSMLLQLGAKSIHEVSDGAAALNAIRSIRLDVMIVDWDLAVLSARVILKAARAKDLYLNPNLPIIVISNSGQSGSVREAIELVTCH